MTITTYDRSSQQAVVDLILSIQCGEFGIDINIDQQPDLLTIENFYQVNKGNFWTAIVEGQLVGTIALLDIGNGQGALRKMFVHKDYRGSLYGIGIELLTTLLIWASDHGITAIYLGTTKDLLGAHRFYEKNNFERIDVNKLPDAFPIMKVDTIFYQTYL